MVIGAGEAGKVIIKEIIDSQLLTMKICCVIDDDRNKVGRYINGVPIVGNRSTILSNVENIKLIALFWQFLLLRYRKKGYFGNL